MVDDGGMAELCFSDFSNVLEVHIFLSEQITCRHNGANDALLGICT